MTEWMAAEEVTAFVQELFHKDEPIHTCEWLGLTPSEFGLLSWHIDNFYCSPLWWLEVPVTGICETCCAVAVVL